VASPADSTVYLIESDWNQLQKAIALFGDYIPRNNFVGKCIVPDRQLSLCLAEWVSHPTQHAAATMNPWTRLLAQQDFVEILLARIQSPNA
jgi:hypothetical protein